MRTLILVLAVLAFAGIGWFFTRKKEEEKVDVRAYKRTITVRGHTRSKSKGKKKKRS